jgi:putative OPT family oligopeptide transporter
MSAQDPPRAEVISEGVPEHKPFVPPEANLKELTPVTLIMGSILGIIFALSSVYLGLKVGLTVSASIPVAVLSITLFRWMKLGGNVLQNNIVQTTGSAGESLAAGVAFTLPSLLLMGFDLELLRILLVALLGGLIGVLMMIPLRHGLIVKEHGKLTYPEGTACADVLIVGEKGGTEATTVFTGFFVGLIYAFFNLIVKLWPDTSTIPLDFGGKLKKGSVGFEVSPPMLGVGYIIGPKVSANMLAGGLLAFVVLIPMIAQFGGETVAAMSPGAIRTGYILYIGAGAVATGGFIALGRSIPTIISAFRRGLGNLSTSKGGSAKVLRTEQDLSMKWVLGGSAAIALAIALAPVLDISLVAALLVVLFGFFFVTVSSRITGEIGSSSNPISGMTIATLLLTCGLFVLAGWTGVGYKAMALTTAALVCVAASNGGTISQDLKTGYLVGSTPKHQQVAILVGVITSAIAIGFTMLMLNESRTTYQAVRFDGVTVKAGSQTGSGPDGGHYHVAFLREEQTAPGGETVRRGKYLVSDAGELMFRVDPSVGDYPWKLEKATGSIPQKNVDDMLAKLRKDTPNAQLQIDLGIDREPYRVVDLGDTTNGLRPGRYLIDEQNQVAFHAAPLEKYDAPKAHLFQLIIDGVLGGKLPWGLVLIGVFIAIIMELVGVSSLPFAVGLYLPVSTSGAIFVGGAVRWLVEKRRKDLTAAEAEFSPGMLMASGLIAGGAITGVVQSVLLTGGWDKPFDLSDDLPAKLVLNDAWWPMLPFLGMAAYLYFVAMKKKKA